MTETIIHAGQVAMAITALAALFAGAWWFVRRIVHIADAVDQLLPNGGSSMKDQMNRMETDLPKAVAEQVAKQLAEHVEKYHQGVRVHG